MHHFGLSALFRPSQVPVWGQLPSRPGLRRRARSVVRDDGLAELTMGHIPVLRDESIDCLLSGVDGANG